MRVLFVVHGFPPYALGGTEVYTSNLARALVQRGDEVFVFAREADSTRPEYQTRTEEQHGVHVTFVNNTFRDVQSFEDSYRCPAIRRVGAALVDRIQPDIVHIQHLTCLSTELVYELSDRGLPIFLTLNDYWLICHRGQLLDLDYRRCDGPFDDGCDRCVGAAGSVGGAGYRVARVVRSFENNLPPGALEAARRAVARVMALVGEDTSAAASRERLAHMRDVVARITHVLAPSSTVYEQFLKFGIHPSRMTRFEYGIDVTRSVRKRERQRGPLRIGFAGSLFVSKAPHLLLEAFAGLPSGSATLDIFGAYAAYHGDDRYRGQLEPLLGQPNVTMHGAIPHEQVPEALASLDVLVVPSVWLENAPLVIREAFAAGVPVVTSRLGGMAESVSDGRNGLLFAPGSVDDLRRCLRRFIDEPALLDQLRGGIERLRSIEEDAAATREMYLAQQASLPPQTRRRIVPGAISSSMARVAAVVLNHRTPDQTFLAVRALQGSQSPIADIVVLDNGSNDGSEASLGHLLPEVPITALPGNLGFSGGCNVGIRTALERGADFVVLVNSDAIVPPETLGHLLNTMAAHPRVGIVGPVLLSRRFPGIVASAGMTFSARTGRMRHREFGRHWTEPPDPLVTMVNGVSGCVMLVKREVFEQAGLLDERYFFSFEDLEFCLRAARAGFLSAIDHRVVAYHAGGASIRGRSAQRIYFATRNHLMMANETPCPGGAIGRRLRDISIVSLNTAFAITNGEIPCVSGLTAVARGIWDHARGQYGGSLQA